MVRGPSTQRSKEDVLDLIEGIIQLFQEGKLIFRDSQTGHHLTVNIEPDNSASIPEQAIGVEYGPVEVKG
jgi:hypothetical protein